MTRRILPGDNHATSRREAEIDAGLRESIRAAGLEGKPLSLQSSPFTLDRGATISGMFGPPAWAVRLRQIHDARTQLTVTLETAWKEHARRWQGRPEQFASHWRDFLQKLDLTKLNTLIEKHNDYYPIEARLPIQYPKPDYHVPRGIEWPQKPVTVEALLADYPPDLDMALFFTREQ